MNLNKTINLNKKYILLLVLLNVIGLCSYYSYALFQVNIIKNNAIVIQSAAALPTITTTIDNTNSNSFALPANGTQTITVNLNVNNVNNVAITSAIAYKMYYDITGNGTFSITSTETFPDNKVEGSLTGTKTISLTFTNNSANDLTITLGAVSGLETQGATLTTQTELLVNTSLPISQGGGNNQSGIPTMAEMCPNCEFMFTTNWYEYYSDDTGSSGTTRGEISETLYTSQQIDSLTNESGHPYFLGVEFDGNTSSSKIIKAYACGIEPDSELPFCIRGYTDDTYQSDNFAFMEPIFGQSNCSIQAEYCETASGGFIAPSDSIGYVDVYDDNGYCNVDNSGYLYCGEW